MAGKRRVVKHDRAERPVNEIERFAMIESCVVERSPCSATRSAAFIKTPRRGQTRGCFRRDGLAWFAVHRESFA